MQVATSMDKDNGTVVKRLSVPLGLEELMESLTKQVLQKKPNDIYSFASDHFAHLLAIRDKATSRGNNYTNTKTKSVDLITSHKQRPLLKTSLIRNNEVQSKTKLDKSKGILQRHRLAKYSAENTAEKSKESDRKTGGATFQKSEDVRSSRRSSTDRRKQYDKELHEARVKRERERGSNSGSAESLSKIDTSKSVKTVKNSIQRKNAPKQDSVTKKTFSGGSSFEVLELDEDLSVKGSGNVLVKEKNRKRSNKVLPKNVDVKPLLLSTVFKEGGSEILQEKTNCKDKESINSKNSEISAEKLSEKVAENLVDVEKASEPELESLISKADESISNDIKLEVDGISSDKLLISNKSVEESFINIDLDIPDDKNEERNVVIEEISALHEEVIKSSKIEAETALLSKISVDTNDDKLITELVTSPNILQQGNEVKELVDRKKEEILLAETYFDNKTKIESAVLQKVEPTLNIAIVDSSPNSDNMGDIEISPRNSQDESNVPLAAAAIIYSAKDIIAGNLSTVDEDIAKILLEYNDSRFSKSFLENEIGNYKTEKNDSSTSIRQETTSDVEYTFIPLKDYSVDKEQSEVVKIDNLQSENVVFGREVSPRVNSDCDEQLSVAARSIQVYWRGHKLRQKLALKSLQKPTDCDELLKDGNKEDMMMKAAVTIQAFMRGHLVRKEIGKGAFFDVEKSHVLEEIKEEVEVENLSGVDAIGGRLLDSKVIKEGLVELDKVNAPLNNVEVEYDVNKENKDKSEINVDVSVSKLENNTSKSEDLNIRDSFKGSDLISDDLLQQDKVIAVAEDLLIAKSEIDSLENLQLKTKENLVLDNVENYIKDSNMIVPNISIKNETTNCYESAPTRPLTSETNSNIGYSESSIIINAQDGVENFEILQETTVNENSFSTSKLAACSDDQISLESPSQESATTVLLAKENDNENDDLSDNDDLSENETDFSLQSITDVDKSEVEVEDNSSVNRGVVVSPLPVDIIKEKLSRNNDNNIIEGLSIVPISDLNTIVENNVFEGENNETLIISNENDEGKSEEKNLIILTDIISAATKIQSMFRGYQVRAKKGKPSIGIIIEAPENNNTDEVIDKNIVIDNVIARIEAEQFEELEKITNKYKDNNVNNHNNDSNESNINVEPGDSSVLLTEASLSDKSFPNSQIQEISSNENYGMNQYIDSIIGTNDSYTTRISSDMLFKNKSEEDDVVVSSSDDSVEAKKNNIGSGIKKIDQGNIIVDKDSKLKRSDTVIEDNIHEKEVYVTEDKDDAKNVFNSLDGNLENVENVQNEKDTDIIRSKRELNTADLKIVVVDNDKDKEANNFENDLLISLNENTEKVLENGKHENENENVVVKEEVISNFPKNKTDKDNSNNDSEINSIKEVINVKVDKTSANDISEVCNVDLEKINTDLDVKKNSEVETNSDSNDTVGNVSKVVEDSGETSIVVNVSKENNGDDNNLTISEKNKDEKVFTAEELDVSTLINRTGDGESEITSNKQELSINEHNDTEINSPVKNNTVISSEDVSNDMRIVDENSEKLNIAVDVLNIAVDAVNKEGDIKEVSKDCSNLEKVTEFYNDVKLIPIEVKNSTDVNNVIKSEDNSNSDCQVIKQNCDSEILAGQEIVKELESNREGDKESEIKSCDSEDTKGDKGVINSSAATDKESQIGEIKLDILENVVIEGNSNVNLKCIKSADDCESNSEEILKDANNSEENVVIETVSINDVVNNSKGRESNDEIKNVETTIIVDNLTDFPIVVADEVDNRSKDKDSTTVVEKYDLANDGVIENSELVKSKDSADSEIVDELPTTILISSIDKSNDPNDGSFSNDLDHDKSNNIDSPLICKGENTADDKIVLLGDLESCKIVNDKTDENIDTVLENEVRITNVLENDNIQSTISEDIKGIKDQTIFITDLELDKGEHKTIVNVVELHKSDSEITAINDNEYENNNEGLIHNSLNDHMRYEDITHDDKRDVENLDNNNKKEVSVEIVKTDESVAKEDVGNDNVDTTNKPDSEITTTKVNIEECENQIDKEIIIDDLQNDNIECKNQNMNEVIIMKLPKDCIDMRYEETNSGENIENLGKGDNIDCEKMVKKDENVEKTVEGCDQNEITTKSKIECDDTNENEVEMIVLQNDTSNNTDFEVPKSECRNADKTEDKVIERNDENQTGRIAENSNKKDFSGENITDNLSTDKILTENKDIVKDFNDKVEKNSLESNSGTLRSESENSTIEKNQLDVEKSLYEEKNEYLEKDIVDNKEKLTHDFDSAEFIDSMGSIKILNLDELHKDNKISVDRKLSGESVKEVINNINDAAESKNNNYEELIDDNLNMLVADSNNVEVNIAESDKAIDLKSSNEMKDSNDKDVKDDEVKVKIENKEITELKNNEFVPIVKNVNSDNINKEEIFLQDTKQTKDETYSKIKDKSDEIENQLISSLQEIQAMNETLADSLTEPSSSEPFFLHEQRDLTDDQLQQTPLTRVVQIAATTTTNLDIFNTTTTSAQDGRGKSASISAAPSFTEDQPLRVNVQSGDSTVVGMVNANELKNGVLPLSLQIDDSPGQVFVIIVSCLS